MTPTQEEDARYAAKRAKKAAHDLIKTEYEARMWAALADPASATAVTVARLNVLVDAAISVSKYDPPGLYMDAEAQTAYIAALDALAQAAHASMDMAYAALVPAIRLTTAYPNPFKTSPMLMPSISAINSMLTAFQPILRALGRMEPL